ncbi:Chloroperoxidase [Armillaria nabsnona]|nr:Chloroperoxidase [Armillaria nabsnona]
MNLHQWQAPGASDLRSPCPGLNTLANHGFLPQDGRNIVVNMCLTPTADGFNIDRSVLFPVVEYFLLSTKTPLSDSFTLDDLKLHGIIEHDASLSRSDYTLGDSLHFNETVYTTLTQSNPASTTSTPRPRGKSRRNGSLTTPSPTLVSPTPSRSASRTGESALYLSVMGDPVTGVAFKKFMDVFFRQERMPIEEGWTKPSTVITGQTLFPIAAIIVNASM